MARVEGYTEDDLAAIEADFALVVQQSMQRVADKTAAQLHPAVVAASLVAASSASLGPADVAIVTQLWEEEVDGVLTPYIGEVYIGSATQVAVGTATAFPDGTLPGVQLVADDYALTYLASIKNQLVNGGDDLWEDIRAELIDGVQQGQSIEQIAARIQGVTAFTEKESLRIARTQVHAAAESGSLAQVRFMGYKDDEVTKEWVATLGDGRTRPTHIAAHGQTVPMNTKFTVGGSKLDFPGDPSGPADEIEQCRCTTVFNFDTPPKLRCDSHAITAAATPTTCVVPIKKPDISHLDIVPPGKMIPLGAMIFNEFMKAKITPAYGGAKIHKVLQSVRTELVGQGYDMTGVTDLDMVTAITKYHLAKKDTFFDKYVAWAQSPAGVKTLGSPLPTPKAVTAPITATTPATAPLKDIPALPPIPAQPSAGNLQFTGKTMGGVNGSQVWVDTTTGVKWLFKAPKMGSNAYSVKFLLDLESMIARIQSKGLKTRPAIYQVTLGGKTGIIQSMFDATDAWPTASKFDPLKLSAADLMVLQQEQIFDWMISNFDTHTGQWLRVGGGGRLLGIDKGQAFKFFGKDKLDWDYTPVYPLSPNGLTYQPLWQAYVKGADIDLQDPTVGPLGEYMDRLIAIDDNEYRDLLRPYAVGRVQQFEGGSPAEQAKKVEKFLDAAVERKNSLKTDFAAFWARAQKERAKHVAPKPPSTPTSLPPPATLPTPPKPVTSPATTIGGGDDGDISGFDFFAKSDVLEMWIAQGGGTKVTPAWGGAKIYKMLIELEKGHTESWLNAGIASEPPNMLQLLRMLDDAGGFKGKPKTYESVVIAWLKEPKSKAVVDKVGQPDGALSDIAFFGPTSSVKPIVPPAAAIVDEATDVLATGEKKTLTQMLAIASNYKKDDVIGYIQHPVTGTVYRVVSKGDGTAKLESKMFAADWKFIEDITPDNVHTFFTFEVAIKPPPGIIGKSIIPGKAPGDVVTFDEINASKYMWANGDIVATAKIPGGYYYLAVSDGKGKFIIEYQIPGDTDWHQYSTMGMDLLDDMMFGTKMTWKLGPSALKSAKAGAIPNYDEGAVIDAAYLLDNLNAKSDVIIAYAEVGVTEFRVRLDSIGMPMLEARTKGTKAWGPLMPLDASDPGAAIILNGKTWYVAKADGGMPDTFKTTVPGVKVPGVAPAAHMSGFKEGDPVYVYQLQQLGSVSPPQIGAIVAEGPSTFPSVSSVYRIVYTGDGWYVQVKSHPNATVWVTHSIQSDADVPTTVSWTASAKKISVGDAASLKYDSVGPYSGGPSKPIKKAAKKAAKKATPAPSPIIKKAPPAGGSHITGKSVGDEVTIKDIFDNIDKYPDGFIVAVPKYKGWQNRRYVIFQGKIIEQTQTSAGSWKNDELITASVTWKMTKLVKLDEGQITKPQLNAAQKFVDKKTPKPYTPPTSTASKSSTSSAPKPPPSPSTIMIRHVDLSHWNDVERDEIYKHFRGLGSLSATPSAYQAEKIWAMLQQTKSHFQTHKSGKYLNLNEIEILRIIDAHNAKKNGWDVATSHPFEQVVVTWMKTPSGKAYINKRIDAPLATDRIPKPMSDFSSYPDPDSQTYSVVSVSQAEKLSDDSHAKYGGFKTGQKAALREYTGGVSGTWNGVIRTGDLSSYEQSILRAQGGMRPSTRAIMTHRGTNFVELNDPSIVSYETLLPYVGRTYVNRGFNSTSVGGRAAFHGSLLIEFELPAGTPMAFVQPFSRFPHENEMLLPTHLIYEIKSVKKNGSQTVMRVRVIGVAEP